MYNEVYDELFKKVTDHPQIINKLDESRKYSKASKRLSLLLRFVSKETIFIEIGPGDCALAIAVSKYVKYVLALDVSKEIISDQSVPDNVMRVLYNGIDNPLGQKKADVIFSDNLIEHLHPEEVVEQTQRVYDILKPGGKYICITPN